jgi:hypothetical protein
MIPHIQYKGKTIVLWRIYGNNRTYPYSVRNGIWYKTVVDDAGRLNSWLQPTMITICSWNTMRTTRSLPCNIAKRSAIEGRFKADEILR